MIFSFIQTWFQINAATGAVSTKSGVDRERVEKCNLVITVNDTQGTTNLPQTASCMYCILLSSLFILKLVAPSSTLFNLIFNSQYRHSCTLIYLCFFNNVHYTSPNVNCIIYSMIISVLTSFKFKISAYSQVMK